MHLTLISFSERTFCKREMNHTEVVQQNVDRVDRLESALDSLSSTADFLTNALAGRKVDMEALINAEELAEKSFPDLLSRLHSLHAQNNLKKKALKRVREAAIAELTASVGVVDNEIEDLRRQISQLDNNISVSDIELAVAKQKLSGAVIRNTPNVESDSNDTCDASRQDAHALVSDPRLLSALTSLPSAEAVEAFLQRMEANSGPISTRRALRSLLD